MVLLCLCFVRLCNTSCTTTFMFSLVCSIHSCSWNRDLNANVQYSYSVMVVLLPSMESHNITQFHFRIVYTVCQSVDESVQSLVSAVPTIYKEVIAIPRLKLFPTHLRCLRGRPRSSAKLAMGPTSTTPYSIKLVMSNMCLIVFTASILRR